MPSVHRSPAPHGGGCRDALRAVRVPAGVAAAARPGPRHVYHRHPVGALRLHLDSAT